jgi:hypothetical protein
MNRFPTAGHLLSWAGLVPRLDESAGKRRSTRIKKGAPWLKPVLVQCAWLQNLKRGLLSHPVHDIRDAKPPLPASGLRQPDPTNFARPIASCQQCMTQCGDERRSILLRFLDRLPVHPRRPLVAYYVQ